MTQNALPSTADIIGPAKDVLVAVRPSATPHIEDGHYADVLVGMEGPIEVSRARLADEIAATRLSAEGQPLTDLCRSEFDTIRLGAPTAAIGEAVLDRLVIHYALSSTFTVDAGDATDGPSVQGLFLSIRFTLNAHAHSVYSSVTGTGAHLQSTTPITLSYICTTMQDFVDTANNLKTVFNDHLLEDHPDEDGGNLIGVPNAFASDGAGSFSSNTVAAQQSVLRIANAVRRAFDKHAAILANPGTVKKGTKWIVAAAPTSNPPIQGGTYLSTLDITVATGQGTVSVPIQASRAGSASNLPLWDIDHLPSVTLSGTLYDASAAQKFSTTTLRAAGGSDGQKDEELRRAAQPRYTGRYGPTTGALRAGALAPGNVVRFALLEDLNVGTAHVYVADPSWAQSDLFLASVQKDLTDNWLGAGCRVSRGTVRNRIVRVEATIALKDAKYLADPSDITADLQTALLSYFDDRPDWYTFKLSALRGVCSRTSRKILSCSLVVVRDENGLPISEPSAPHPGDDLTHFWFGDNALTPTYLIPT